MKALTALCLLSLLSCAPGGGEQPLIAEPSATPASKPATATPQELTEQPVGFPLDPTFRPMRVVQTPLGREIAPAAADGPTAREVARDFHTRAENDFEANRYGWNCRLHNTYEGAPAVDWYLPTGTPVVATMRGQAELYVITTVNSYAYYGVTIDTYLGLPSPSQPRYSFPGPSGGMGVFVSVLNGPLRAEYGHLDLAATLALVPESAFLPPYSRTFPFTDSFARPLNPDQGTLVARWPVEKGETVASVGNSGYSDVSHLHYQIVTEDRKTKFCPTDEPLRSSGWLFRRPAGFP